MDTPTKTKLTQTIRSMKLQLGQMERDLDAVERAIVDEEPDDRPSA